jgi:negative regulator of replication initiation
VFSLHIPHDRYEGLCAAAVTGQIKPDELDDLKQHMSTCADCRQFVGDAGQIAAQVIPEYGEKHAPVAVLSGINERFIVRANYEGIPLRSRAGSGKRRIKSGTAVVVLAVGLAAAAAASGILWVFNRYRGAEEVARRIQATAPSSDIAAVTRNGREEQLVRENGDLQKKLASLQAQLDSFARDIKSDQKALEVANLQQNSLSSRLPAVEGDNAELRKNLADRDTQLAQLKAELDSAQSSKDASNIASQVEEAELNTLRDQVAKLRADLRESEQLSEAANRAKDVIIARNLHIVDVRPDAGESGKHKRAFGRIFYAEGQSLVFYAYDLTDPRKLNAKIHFHVWGEKQGVPDQRAKTLGVFHSDDKNDGRWVLTFDDPKVMAQIDSVFVTVESDKQSVTKPTGKKILYAYLGNKPNHP